MGLQEELGLIYRVIGEEELINNIIGRTTAGLWCNVGKCLFGVTGRWKDGLWGHRRN